MANILNFNSHCLAYAGGRAHVTHVYVPVLIMIKVNHFGYQLTWTNTKLYWLSVVVPCYLVQCVCTIISMCNIVVQVRIN